MPWLSAELSASTLALLNLFSIYSQILLEHKSDDVPSLLQILSWLYIFLGIKSEVLLWPTRLYLNRASEHIHQSSHFLTAVLEERPQGLGNSLLCPSFQACVDSHGTSPAALYFADQLSSQVRDSWAPYAALPMVPDNSWHSTEQGCTHWLFLKWNVSSMGTRALFCSPLCLQHLEEALRHSRFSLYIFRRRKVHHIFLIPTLAPLFWASDLIAHSEWLQYFEMFSFMCNIHIV